MTYQTAKMVIENIFYLQMALYAAMSEMSNDSLKQALEAIRMAEQAVKADIGDTDYLDCLSEVVFS